VRNVEVQRHRLRLTPRLLEELAPGVHMMGEYREDQRSLVHRGRGDLEWFEQGNHDLVPVGYFAAPTRLDCDSV
jgi:hypothetical protein